MIQIVEIGKVYGKKEQSFSALDGVSFTVPDGASVAIVGKSGSGKSTLMHIMSGLDHPSTGAVVIDEQDISSLKAKEIDKFRVEKIGFIFQSFFVQANETCYNNVALPLEISGIKGPKRKQRILTALKQVELDDKVNQKAGNLSGGQKQRLAIARAIVNVPRIIFADEPTGNLDTVTGAKVEQLLFGFNRKLGSTLVIVTHDEELATRCDMQVHLQDGKVTKITHHKAGKK